MDVLPDWPGADSPKDTLASFRSQVLASPIRIRQGFSPVATKKLIGALLPSPTDHETNESLKIRNRFCYSRIHRLVPRLRDCLKKGADPCARVEAVQGHFMPLSMAASLALGEAVDVLLQAGAWREWPTRDIEQIALAGGEDIPYDGLLPDPLAEAARTLGTLAEEAQGAMEAARIARRLVEHGSCPLTPDPGCGRTPMEELCRAMADSGPLPEPSRQAIADLMWGWIEAATPEEEIRYLAKGDRRVVGSIEPIPGVLADPIQARAKQHLLGQSLKAEASKKRSAPRL